MSNAVPHPVRALLSLFDAELDGLRFPELDASTLATAEREVAMTAARVADAEAALLEARAALAAAQEAMLAKAQRALAYLRVYAEDHPELAAKVERISLPRGTRRAARGETEESGSTAPATPRRRGRRPRDTEAPMLAFGAGAAASAAATPAE